MEFRFPAGFVVPDALFMVVAQVISVVWVVVIVVGVLRRRSESKAHAAEARAAKEHERASIAERELATERERVERLTERRRQPIGTIAAGLAAISEARDEKALAGALAGALERLLDPAQLMVFVAADGHGHEFLLAATAGRRPAPWPLGARLSDTTGRLGLVARRRAVMDEREFAAESQFVRDQVESTEPSAFMCEIAGPVVVDDAALLLVSVGGSSLPFEATREGVELLTSHASDAARGLVAAGVSV